jgi:exodeoxyribonuclease V alpha subunit
MLDILRQAADHGALRDLDVHFARWMAELAGSGTPALWLGACLASRRVGEGDVCLSLPEHAGRVLFEEQAPQLALVAPPLRAWREALLASGVVGRPAEGTPLVLDQRDRLYLARYWQLEQDLAEALAARARRWAEGVDRARLRAGLERLFPASRAPDGQRLAAATALLRSLAVISGGPGTGKTRTVTAILALLAEQGVPAARVGLAAPTGKAAARLGESLRTVKQGLPLDPDLRSSIPEQAATLHRLLGAVPGRVGFRHGPDNPLHLDALVVDEASMVDLPTMSRLLAALPEHARLILLGDRDQLASVEAGAVLGDICGRGRPVWPSAGMREALGEVAGAGLPAPESEQGAPPIADTIALLTRSYRFAAESGIGALAARVNAGDAEGALALLQSGRHPDLRYPPAPEHTPAALAEEAGAGYRTFLEQTEPAEALHALGRFRVLCALREGPWGVRQVNALIEAALRRAGLAAPQTGWYAGRPVMVTRNDYRLGLFNGDVGVLWPDPATGGALRVWFEMPDGELRRLLPAGLPEHETVFAMTVHKSQGSEFDRVMLVLPDRPSPVLTRELIYTGVTRAREHVSVCGPPAVLASAVRRRVERTSSLAERLWGE